MKKHLNLRTLIAVCAVVFTVSNLITQVKVFDVSSSTKDLAVATNSRARDNTELLKNTARSVEILEDVTGAQAEAENDALLAQVIKGLTCDQQRAVMKGVIELGGSGETVMTAECVQFFIDNPQL